MNAFGLAGMATLAALTATPRARAEGGPKLPGYTSPFAGAWDDANREAFMQDLAERDKRTAAELAQLRRQLKETDQLLEKSEPLAALLSGVVGFGAGSYYAHNPDIGHIFLGAEGGLLFLGLATADMTSSTVRTAELIGLLAMRVADTILAVMSASSFNDDLARKAQMAQVHAFAAPGPDPSRPEWRVGLSWRF